MKNLIINVPLLCFNLFALLVAARDAFTNRLLNEDVAPLWMLFVFCLTTTVLALIVNITVNNGSLFRKASKPREGLTTLKLKLGCFTWLVFLICIYGIQKIGAPIFSLIEHSLMPISTVLIASRYLNERLTRTMQIGLFVSIASVVVFLCASSKFEQDVQDHSAWLIGISLAVISSILTSLTSAYQKKLVTQTYTPDEILFIRFLIPTVIMFFTLPFTDAWTGSFETLVKLIILAIVGFALPLVFLCFGFAKASLSRFSAYLILIPAYTFILGAVIVRSELEKLANPWVLFGIVGIVVGYVIFEWPALTARRASKSKIISLEGTSS